MEAKAGWETTSGLLYYLSVAEPVPKIIPAICMPCFSDMPLGTMRGEMTDALT